MDHLNGYGDHSTGTYERDGIYFSANATNNQGLDLLMFFEGFFVGPFIFGSSVTFLFGEELTSKGAFIDLEQLFSYVCMGAVIGLVVGFIFEDNNKRKKTQ